MTTIRAVAPAHREQDKAVAVALGWTVKYDDERECYSLCNPDGAPVISYFPGDGDTREQIEANRWEAGTPHYSTDIAAAMDAARHLVADGWYFRLEAYDAVDEWRVEFKKDGIGRFAAYEATAAETIVQAFLHVVASVDAGRKETP